jgi:hypothetical protein
MNSEDDESPRLPDPIEHDVRYVRIQRRHNRLIEVANALPADQQSKAHFDIQVGYEAALRELLLSRINQVVDWLRMSVPHDDRFRYQAHEFVRGLDRERFYCRVPIATLLDSAYNRRELYSAALGSKGRPGGHISGKRSAATLAADYLFNNDSYTLADDLNSFGPRVALNLDKQGEIYSLLGDGTHRLLAMLALGERELKTYVEVDPRTFQSEAGNSLRNWIEARQIPEPPSRFRSAGAEGWQIT